MNEYQLEVRITPREGLLDPEGKAVEHALHSLEFQAAAHVRVGKLIRLRLRAADDDAAREQADAMCRQFLANPVTEDYTINLDRA